MIPGKCSHFPGHYEKVGFSNQGMGGKGGKEDELLKGVVNWGRISPGDAKKGVERQRGFPRAKASRSISGSLNLKAGGKKRRH